MFQRTTALAILTAGMIGVVTTANAAPDKKPTPAEAAKSKKALQELQEFIGVWNLEGTQKAGGRVTAWKEKVSWGWKFKDGEAWITVTFDDGKGKYFTGGELRYDLDKKKYVLTLTPAEKGAAKEVYEGDFNRGLLEVKRKDAKSKDVYRIKMSTAAEGARFTMKVERQEGGLGLFTNTFAMNGTKEGRSFAGGAKKPECIVSGGAATMTVTYNGKTYYVCCSGCRDEFNANPEKYTKGK